jgi:hypothetical protein
VFLLFCLSWAKPALDPGRLRRHCVWTMPRFAPPDSAALADRFFCDRNEAALLASLDRLATDCPYHYSRARIGASRDGRAIWGITLGARGRPVSITAGAHSDEPLGPMTAMLFAEWLVSSGDGRALLSHHTFRICPQVNPDGAERNSAWFAEPLDPLAYFRGVARELPGDDVEFGYPRDIGPDALENARPENIAVARFLARGGPCALHASLHTMAYAEGAWFLIGRDWAERTARLRERLAAAALELGFPLHDIERHGEKGFHRIANGFCTTPTSTAMRDHFLAQGDPDTASRFRPSSMEFVQSLGGAPLVMVSELPMFTIRGDEPRPDPPGPETAYTRFRPRLPGARAALLRGDEAPARALMNEYHLTPVPLRRQVALQGRMLTEALRFLDEC